MRKRIPFLLAVLCLWASLTASALAAPNVTVTTRLSNDGRVRDASWVTVTMDLVNLGADLQGEVVVEGSDGPRGYLPAYSVPVTLPAGARKQVPVELPYRFGSLKARLVVDGVTVHEETLPLTNLPPSAPLIGVLSDEELGLPALAQIGQETTIGAAQVVRLSAETLPDQAVLLRGFDVLAISRFDTGTLRPEQLRALEIWVARGGSLLLTGGPEWKRTLSALPASLVPVEVTGVGEVSLAPLGDLVARPLNVSAPVALGRLTRGQAVAAAGDVPLLVQAEVGKGRVLYLAADPGLSPLFGWGGQTPLFSRYLKNVQNRDPKQILDDSEGQFFSVLQQIPGFGLPPFGLVVGLLVGYLLLLGPVNYLVLKRLDRREWAWVTVPALSFLFVGSLYAMGVGSRSTMLSHRVTVTEIAPETGAASFRTYLGVFAPSRDRLEFALPDAGLVKALPAYSGSEDELSTRIILGEQTTVALEGLNNYSMRGIVQERDVALKGGLTLTEVELDAGGLLTARVRNGLDRVLTDVRVNIYGQEQSVGDLPAGAVSDPFSLDLAATGQGMRRMSLAPDEETYYRNTLTDAIYNTYGNPVAEAEIVVVGFMAEPLFPVDLPDLGRAVPGGNAVYVRLPLPYDPADGELPPGVVRGVMSNGDGWYDSQEGYILHGGTYTFALELPPLNAAKVAEVSLHVRQHEGTLQSLRVKNPTTGEWEEMETASVQTLPDWAKRMNAGGTLELEITTAGAARIAMPTISTKGVDR